MAINNITQTISILPPAGRRGVDVQTQFVIKQEDFQDHLQGTTVTELNTFKDQLNSRIGEINSTATTMNDYANTATTSATTATTKAGEASTSAGEALSYRNQAETFKNNASASATKASQWSDNNYNVEVEAGKYSAKHWSTVAQNATANKIDKVASTDNAIVRFDGATGQVQNSAIIIDDNGNIGSGTQSFNGFGGSGFKNYIINDKKVINQRALTSTDNSYNQDRWYKVGNNWFQGIEGDNNLISGKKYTLSWVGSATASYYVGGATSSTINAQSFTSIANGGNFTLTISAGQNLWIKFASDATGSTFSFVQLEEGSVATPFESRPVGLELSLCQRYYEKLTNVNTPFVMYTLNGDTRVSIPFKVKKRLIPECTISGTINSLAVGKDGAAVNMVLTISTVHEKTVDGIYAITVTNPSALQYCGTVVSGQGHCELTAIASAEL